MKDEMTLTEYRAWLKEQEGHKPAPRDDREHQEQCALFEWAATMEGRLPELRLLFAVPNGGARHPAVAAKMKAEGCRAGVWDVFLPCPQSGGYAGLWLEMKAGANYLTDAQLEWQRAMIDQGYACYICYDWQIAARQIVRYLDEDPKEYGL